MRISKKNLAYDRVNRWGPYHGSFLPSPPMKVLVSLFPAADACVNIWGFPPHEIFCCCCTQVLYGMDRERTAVLPCEFASIRADLPLES